MLYVWVLLPFDGEIKMYIKENRMTDQCLFFCTVNANVWTVAIQQRSCVGYNYNSISIRRPFDCLSKVIEVTVT